jgi:hypothetical protein
MLNENPHSEIGRRIFASLKIKYTNVESMQQDSFQYTVLLEIRRSETIGHRIVKSP